MCALGLMGYLDIEILFLMDARVVRFSDTFIANKAIKRSCGIDHIDFVILVWSPVGKLRDR